MKKNLLLLSVLAFFSLHLFGQGTTTSGISGTVTDKNGEALIGATILAVHQPTGSQFGNASNVDGQFNIPNMNVGGPYKLTISSVGFEAITKDNVYLTLGQTQRFTFVLGEEATEIEGVEVVASKAGDVFDGNRTGAETNISEQQLQSLPTISRDLSDFTRMTPQATVNGDGNISIAGANNRFNSVFIDGAVNNDVFGLSSSGTNGGQTGVSPISIDAIEQFQVVIAPYDVKLSGFNGGGINAVTRSGSNNIEGSAYYLFRNQDLAGKTPTDNPDIERTKLANFNSYTTGFRVGGPLIKNKLFFFVNGEVERRETPNPFNFSDYQGDSDASKIANLASTLKSKYGYDVGGYPSTVNTVKSNKFIARLDWNINKDHKLTLRHSYTYGESVSPSRSSNTSINFQNGAVFFPSTTHSSALELKSNFGNTISNNLILGYTNVNDDRDPMGQDFPSVQIIDGRGNIYFGSEAFSMANQLKQSIFTITDNLNIYKGRHVITIGTHNEFYQIYNLFVRQSYGAYQYATLDAFLTDAKPTNYNRSYSLLDNVSGHGSKAAAEFGAMQLGFYIQDEWNVNDKLKLTYGLRLDIPVILDQPKEDTYFNNTTLSKIQEQGYDMYGAKAGKMFNTQFLFAPRIGFNYDVTGDRSTQIRGGLGMFTSRMPLVWLGGSYTNNGLTVGGVSERNPNITFRPDVNNQYKAEDFGRTLAIPSGQMDLWADNLKFPQVLRGSLAIDQKLPWGLVGTVEFMYSKTLNNVTYYNYNIKPSTKNALPPTGSTAGDQRPLYDRSSANLVDKTYSGIYVGTNTNEGYSYNFTAQLQKSFDKGFAASIAYNYGDAYAINDGTSSQNSSQWRFTESVNGRNRLALSRSDFSAGSRIIANVSYRKEYFNFGATTISLFYEGRSGSPFSFLVANGNRMTNEDSGDAELMYVPRNQSEILLVTKNGVTPDQQWTDLNAYIEADDYLKTRRGQYVDRNASRTPFTNVIDLRILQDFFIKAGGKKHNFQLSVDVFNFTNMVNKDWGRRYFVSNDAYGLLRFESFQNGVPAFSFTKPTSNPWGIDDLGTSSSRWQAQIGIRYIFN